MTCIKPILFTGTLLLLSCWAWGQSKPMLDEPFDQNALRWPEYQSQNILLDIENGHYIIENKDGSDVIAERPVLLDETRDFVIRCRIRQTAGMARSRVGLIWGMKNYQEYFAFEISPSGQFSVYDYYLGKVNLLKPWADEARILGKNNYNTLEIRKTQNDIIFYINEQQVYLRAFDGLHGSRLGFIASAGTTLQVDHLVVEQDALPVEIVKDWMEVGPREMLKEVNSPYIEERPVLADQGNTLFFVREGHPQNQGLRKRMDVWMSRLQGGQWGEAQPVGGFNTEGDDYLAGIVPDGQTAWVGHTEWGSNAFDVLVRQASGQDGEWRETTRMGIPNFYANTPQASYSLSADGQYLLMAVERDDSYGGRDLYLSAKDANGQWVEPRNLGPAINSSADEISAYLAKDGLTLFFASEGLPGYGGADLYMTRRLDDTWTRWETPRNLGPSVNTEGQEAFFALSPDETYGYFSSSQAARGISDLYRVALKPLLPSMAAEVENDPAEQPSAPAPPSIPAPDRVASWRASGRVLNPITGAGVPAQVVWVGQNGEQMQAQADAQGYFEMAAPAEGSYQVTAKLPGHWANTATVAAGAGGPTLEIVPMGADQPFQLQNLPFDVSKASIASEALPELDRLALFLTKYPDLQLEIVGHTDNSGTEQANLLLSQGRAQAVANYLQSRGVQTDRITVAGFGSTKPLASNQTEEGKKQNRRVDFRILPN